MVFDKVFILSKQATARRKRFKEGEFKVFEKKKKKSFFFGGK